MRNTVNSWSTRRVGFGRRISEAGRYDLRQAIKETGLDYKVGRLKLYARPNGVTEEIQDSRAVYKLDDQGQASSYIATVGGLWTPVQTEDAFAALQVMAGRGGQFLRGGETDNGRTQWMEMRLGEVKIGGDIIESTVVARQSNDGGSCLIYCTHERRLVCTNGMTRLVQVVKWSFRHTTNVKERLQAAELIMASTGERLKEVEKAGNELLAIPFGESRFHGLVEALLPIPEDASTRMKNTLNDTRAALYTELSKEDLANVAQTGWGAYQAVAAATTHLHRLNDDQNKRDKKFLQQLDENELLQRAHQLILAAR